MLKKTFSILLIGLAFISCEKEIIGPDISAVVNFSIVNSNGNDLLNPSVIGAITEENTEVFLLKNGTKVRLYQGNLDAPKFLKIISQNGKNVFRMFFDITNENFKDDRITQYIRFKDGSEIKFTSLLIWGNTLSRKFPENRIIEVESFFPTIDR